MQKPAAVPGRSGSPTGRIDAGHWGDLVVIDLEHPSLAGCEVETLAEAVVSGADNGVVRGTYVGGNWKQSPGRSLTGGSSA